MKIYLFIKLLIQILSTLLLKCSIWVNSDKFRSQGWNPKYSLYDGISEIKDLQENGINYVHFDDDTFGIQKEWIRELCIKLKKECPKISFSCEIHCKGA